MSRLGTTKALLWFAALCAAFGVVPSHAASTTLQGQIGHAWVSPTSGETLNGVVGNDPVNMVTGQHSFGFTILPESVGGFSASSTWRCFELSADDGVTDLDVYFYVGADPASPWDIDAGVHSGSENEHSRIPAGSTHAFVMISYTNAGSIDVNFNFKVSDATSC